LFQNEKLSLRLLEDEKLSESTENTELCVKQEISVSSNTQIVAKVSQETNIH
jgi:hypothetical protein